MELNRLNYQAAEAEATEVQERAQALSLSAAQETSAKEYQEAHNQITAERLEEMKSYVTLEGLEEDPEKADFVLQYLARNYRAAELEAVDLRKLKFINKVCYADAFADVHTAQEYTRSEFDQAKAEGALPTGEGWQRVRAAAFTRSDSDRYGSMELYDLYEYDYEIPKHIKGAKDPERAHLSFLIAHEIAHKMYKMISAKDDHLDQASLYDTEYGKFVLTRYENGYGLNEQNIPNFLNSPFTPYLEVRRGHIEPLHQRLQQGEDDQGAFYYEYLSYVEEFITEAAGLSKTKDWEEMSELEKFFVYHYDKLEDHIRNLEK